MDFYDILLAKKLNGEGGGDSTGIIVTEEILPNGGIVKHIEGQVISGTKQISNNGEFDVSAYKSVNVNVSGGGSLDLHPKITMNVNVVNENIYMVNNAIVVGDDLVVIQGNNAVIDMGDLDEDNRVRINTGETKEVTCFVPLGPNTVATYNLISKTMGLQEITFANCVNCEGFEGELEIIDDTQDASAEVTLIYSPIS